MKPTRERVEDAMREIGTLLLAFAPLDAALNPGTSHGGALLLLFLALGLLFFLGALFAERWRARNA